jgi:hypothetical protein
MSKTHCAEVLSVARIPRDQSERSNWSQPATDPPQTRVKVLLIAERVDGFYLQRFSDSGERLGETRHDTMDEAMSYAYSEYDEVSDWRFCPDDADPLDYFHRQSNP